MTMRGEAPPPFSSYGTSSRKLWMCAGVRRRARRRRSLPVQFITNLLAAVAAIAEAGHLGFEFTSAEDEVLHGQVELAGDGVVLLRDLQHAPGGLRDLFGLVHLCA